MPLPTKPPRKDPSTQQAYAPSTPNDVILVKLKNIADDLRPFVQVELDEKLTKKIIKPQLYCIILHFHPLTKSRPSHLKANLVEDFNKSVKPLIKPYSRLSPSHTPTSDQMETDENTHDPDFDPLSSKTTCQMLREAIEKKEPDLHIPKTSLHEGLLWLYKAYVAKDLVLPNNS